MYKKRAVLTNERGVTLIELLVSMVILGIVLFSLTSKMTDFAIQSKQADTKLVLLQEANKNLEEQRQSFYDRQQFITFTSLNDKPTLATFHANVGSTQYYGEVNAELVEQFGRYQLIKLSSSLTDINATTPAVEVSEYVTNR